MNQTMLGLLALAIAMLISVQVMQASFRGQTRVIDNEMETMAGGVALAVLDYVGSQDFDEATASGTVQDPSQLTPQPFVGGKAYMQADDIDDFDHILTHTVTAFDHDFSIDITVQYVEENNPEQDALSPTFAKRVTVTVNNPILQTPMQLAHVYSYP